MRRDLNTLRASVDDSSSTGTNNNVSISLIGAISTTVTSVGRLLGDFDNYVSNQTDVEAQKKNQNRLDRLKTEYEEAKREFLALKERREETIRESEKVRREQERSALFGQTEDIAGKASGVSDNPYSVEFRSNRKLHYEKMDTNGMLMDQEMKLNSSNAKLDEILELGRHAFGDIVEQNETVLKVREKMSQGLSTLGVSHNTVLQIEKVMWEDRIIFYLGAAVTFFIMWLIWKYLG